MNENNDRCYKRPFTEMLLPCEYPKHLMNYTGKISLEENARISNENTNSLRETFGL